jgi:hypothetical protein
MKDQAEEVTRIVENEVAFQERMRSDADKAATALIQSYLGPTTRSSTFPIFTRRSLKRSKKRASRARSIDQAKRLRYFSSTAGDAGGSAWRRIFWQVPAS